jgi:penicillin-binding protein-related factor A (putative recombinase)
VVSKFEPFNIKMKVLSRGNKARETAVLLIERVEENDTYSFALNAVEKLWNCVTAEDNCKSVSGATQS